MRNALIKKLAEMWRKAEDKFQEVESDYEKIKVWNYQVKMKLTKEEEAELNEILQGWGV